MSSNNRGNNNFIVLTGIPVGCSINGLYATFVRGRRPIRIKSREAILAQKAFAEWALLNVKSIIDARNTIALWEARFVEVSMYLCLKKERILCKDGSPKKIDATNYLKSTHDLIADKLGIDDSCFVRAPVEKCVAEVEEVIITIRPRELRTSSDIKKVLFCDPNEVERIDKQSILCV